MTARIKCDDGFNDDDQNRLMMMMMMMMMMIMLMRIRMMMMIMIMRILTREFWKGGGMVCVVTLNRENRSRTD